MASRQQRIACLLLLELFHWCPISLNAEPPSNTDPAFIKKTVDEHNKYRSQVKPSATAMLYMSWDGKLSAIALEYANQCKFAHNPKLHAGGLHPEFKSLGENLWLGSSGAPMDATQKWVESEVGNYDFEGNRCTGVCGHYTQVVWADTYKVGCGVAFCSSVAGVSFSNAHLFVCNYGPPGNFRGKRPYNSGKSCADCPAGDKCVNNLCANEKRDQVKAGGPSTKKPSIGNTALASYGVAFVMLHFHSCVFT